MREVPPHWGGYVLIDHQFLGYCSSTACCRFDETLFFRELRPNSASLQPVRSMPCVWEEARGAVLQSKCEVHNKGALPCLSH